MSSNVVASGTISADGWRAVRRKRTGTRSTAASVAEVAYSGPAGPRPTMTTRGCIEGDATGRSRDASGDAGADRGGGGEQLPEHVEQVTRRLDVAPQRQHELLQLLLVDGV